MFTKQTKPNEDTKEWNKFQRGQSYKDRINLPSQIDLCERIFVGDQWYKDTTRLSVMAVTNIIKQPVNQKVAYVLKDPIKYVYKTVGVPSTAPEFEVLNQYMDSLTLLAEAQYERLKMDSLNLEGLTKAAGYTGDYILYINWDTSAKVGQQIGETELIGDISAQIINTLNYYPADPNMPIQRVQEQPYIILTSRDAVSKIKAEAKKNGVSQKDIDQITGDTDTLYTAGSKSQIEIEGKDDDEAKITVITYLYKDENGKVFAKKSTRNVVFKDTYDTKLSYYPIGAMNWNFQEGTYHGISEIAECIPNQKLINKAMSLKMQELFNIGGAKVLLNKQMVSGTQWKNNAVIEVNVEYGNDLHNATAFTTPPINSFDTTNFVNEVKRNTLESIGAFNAFMGNINNPKNTSAITATKEQAAIPIANIAQRFWQMQEDIANVFLDYFINYYIDGRALVVEKDGVPTEIKVDFELLKTYLLRAKIDVIPNMDDTTLTNMFDRQIINVVEFLERADKTKIPQYEKLIAEKKEEKAKLEAEQEQMKQMAMQQAQPQGQPQAPQEGQAPQGDVAQQIVEQLSPEQIQAIADNPQLAAEMIGGM